MLYNHNIIMATYPQNVQRKYLLHNFISCLFVLQIAETCRVECIMYYNVYDPAIDDFLGSAIFDI